MRTIEHLNHVNSQIQPHIKKINQLANKMFYSDRTGLIRWAVEQDEVEDALIYIESMIVTLNNILSKGISAKSLSSLEGMMNYGGFFVDNQPLFSSSIFIEKTKVSKASIDALKDEFLSVLLIINAFSLAHQK